MASRFKTKPTKRQLAVRATETVTTQARAVAEQNSGLSILLQINEFYFGRLPKELPEYVMSVLKGEASIAANDAVPFTDNDARRHIWQAVEDFKAAQTGAAEGGSMPGDEVSSDTR